MAANAPITIAAAAERFGLTIFALRRAVRVKRLPAATHAASVICASYTSSALSRTSTNSRIAPDVTGRPEDCVAIC